MSDTSDTAPPTPSPRRRARPAGAPAAVPDLPPEATAPFRTEQQGSGVGTLMENPDFMAKVIKGLGLTGDTGPALVDADDGEGGMVQFVRTGWVRFPAVVFEADEPRVWKLRRPFLGELRRLRQLYENAELEIDEAKLGFLDATQGHETRVAAANALDTELERSRAKLEANKARRKALHELEDRQAKIRMEWWASVFRTLCVEWIGQLGAVPEEVDEGHVAVPEGWQWGTWVEDPDLPVHVINHWRAVPLDRGGSA
jgi:hypothetical protein